MDEPVSVLRLQRALKHVFKMDDFDAMYTADLYLDEWPDRTLKQHLEFHEYRKEAAYDPIYGMKDIDI